MTSMANHLWAVIAVLVGFCPSTEAAEGHSAVVAYRWVPATYVSEATVEAVKQSTVSAQVAGRIVERHFEVGNAVKQGELLVRIDPSVVEQEVAGSAARVQEVRAQLANAQAELQRSRQLFDQKFISQAALDRAEANYRAAQAGLQAVLAGAGQARVQKSFTAVYAPYSGVVSAVHVELGELAAPGKPLMSGFDPADMRVTARIPQARLAAVQAGMRARVEIPALGQWLEARAVQVLPQADAATHTVDVRVQLPPNTKGLLPGMFARVHFQIGEQRKLVVPQSAVLRRSELQAVYVVDAAGRPQLRQVRLGETTADGAVEILAGVRPGERVALDPLRAGMAAQP